LSGSSPPPTILATWLGKNLHIGIGIALLADLDSSLSPEILIIILNVQTTVSEEILGKYRIVREIGRSNDVVYEAIDTTVNRRVALKELLLPPTLSGVQRRERIERFYREARAAGSLSHPNIVTIYEVGEDKGRHFIAMEYLEGQTLRSVLDVEGSLPLDRVIDIAKQICDALEYAHSKGVIHRDIKPDNIQVLPGGKHIKITDFGIARIMEEPGITVDGQVFGTPSYMSPEQITGKPLDARTDIFSLGVMLYEMLTGKKPFTGDTVVTITYNILNQEVVFPPTIPPQVEHVLRKCLAKDPNMRYSSAAEVAADLDQRNFVYSRPSTQATSPNTTVSISSPSWGQTPSIPPPPSPPVDSGGVALPKPSFLSAEAKYFLKVMFAVIVACTFVVSFIWLLSVGYQRWLDAARKQEFNRYLEAGIRHFESESYRAAIEEFSKALALANNEKDIKLLKRNIAVCYLALGLTAQQSGNFAQALVFCKQAIEFSPDFPDAYLFMGSVLRAMGREDEAIEAWTKAVDLGGGSQVAFDARRHIAEVYNERGDRAYMQGYELEAIDWWQKAVDIAPMPGGLKPKLLRHAILPQ
jgi:serine/threonine protein kinase